MTALRILCVMSKSAASVGLALLDSDRVGLRFVPSGGCTSAERL